jgi:hypothetical protein
VALPKNGVLEAPKIVPSAFGLLAVVDETSAEEDRWIRGFSQEWETDLYALYNVNDTDSTEVQLAGAGDVNYYDEIKPFFIEVQEDRSTFAFLSIDRLERIKRQCDAATQRAVEQELWDGAIRIPSSHNNRALVSSGVSVLASGVAVSPKRALAILEQGIAEASHAGEQGIIHATRDAVALLSSNSQMLFHNKIKDHLQTMGGTPVVVGSGYTGNGPRIPAATATISTNTTLTINTTGDHYLLAGDTVRYSVVGANINQSSTSTAVVTKVDADTVTITIASATNRTQEAVTGYIQQLGTNSAKWIYATGTVRVFLGDVDIVNDSLSQAYDVSGNANDMRVKAIRPAAAFFDTSIHLAVRVDLTA